MKRFITIFTFAMLTIGLSAQDISLPKPAKTGGKPLMEALNSRATIRSIAEKPLSMELLSNLLWAATGINRPDGRMTAPTASNNQEIDVYLFLPQGIYLYDVQNHSLIFKMEGDHRKTASPRQGAPSGVLMIFVADYGRMGRYDNASKELYSATDTGYVSQNVYLFCASEGLATVALGGIDRPAIMELLNISNGKVVLGQSVGYPAGS